MKARHNHKIQLLSTLCFATEFDLSLLSSALTHTTTKPVSIFMVL